MAYIALISDSAVPGALKARRGAAVLLVGLLAACGGGGDGETPPSGSPMPVPTPSLAPSPSPSPTPTPTLAPTATPSPAATPTAVPTPSIQMRSIAPSQTGGSRSNDYGSHWVSWPSALQQPAGAVLFLPGTGARPRAYGDLQSVAVEQGQVVIGLAYVNDLAVNELCTDFASDCHAEVRGEIVYGEDRSPLVEVRRAESIEARLAGLLEHLQTREPAVDWGRLLADDGRPDWALFTVSGHSQGGGHAAFIAQQEGVHRVILLSATEPANWAFLPGATPGDHYYGLAHAEEVAYAGIARSWAFLELPGHPVELDTRVRPAPAGHQFFLVDDDCGSPTDGDDEQRRHGCTAADLYLARDASGLPRLQGLWAAWFRPRPAP